MRHRNSFLRKIGKPILTSSLIFTLVGCASMQPMPVTYEAGAFPKLNKEVVVSSGEVMVSQYDYAVQQRATTEESLGGSFWGNRSGISANTPLVGLLSNTQTVFCTMPLREGSACLEDSNNDGRFDTAHGVNSFGSLIIGTAIDPIAYKMDSAAVQSGFKYELIYQGTSRDTVTISYREYQQNLARPAFQQDLQYTLADSGVTPIRFRDVQLDIIESDNLGIRYIVRSGFNQ